MALKNAPVQSPEGMEHAGMPAIINMVNQSCLYTLQSGHLKNAIQKAHCGTYAPSSELLIPQAVLMIFNIYIMVMDKDSRQDQNLIVLAAMQTQNMSFCLSRI